MRKKPWIDRIYTAYQFDDALRALIHTFKYQDGLYLTHYLASLIIDALHHSGSPILVPVPMYPTRLKARGYNQSLLLAKRLSKQLSLAYDATLCKKIINTPPQAKLDAKRRQQNMHESIRVTTDIVPKHIAIIDDLITTGSTANEIARQLKYAGALRVDLWCCARA